MSAWLRVMLAAALLLPARSGAVGEDMARAQILYLLHCSGCHGADGSGDPRVDVPPFPGNLGAFLRDAEGRRYVVNVGGVMSSGLDDANTATVLNWAFEAFAGDSLSVGDWRRFDAAEVQALRQSRPADVIGLRRDIAARLKARYGIVLPDFPWP